jgi:multicomponent Na+:H+ antiporter subunit A
MLAAIASGFVLAIFAPFFRRVGWMLSLLPAGLAIYFAAAAPAVWRGSILQASYEWAPALGVLLTFRLDGLSLLYALLITGLGAIVVVYGGGYLHGHRHLGRFYAFLLFFMASMLGVVLADNLIVLYIFWELTSISSYLLIGFDHDREAARRAALQALLVTSAGGLALLAGFVLLGHIAGSFEVTALLKQADTIRAHALYLPALGLVLGGAFTKSAQFPFHFWLPGAMEAPTPVSAYLHAATMVKAGVYLLARLSPVMGGTEAWTIAVTAVGGVTMLAGGVLALNKTDLKQILAYSTVSVLGILTFLIGIGSTAALKAMAVYLVAHGLYKGALFLVAGAVDHETGTRDITKLGGIWKAMPLTAGAGLLAALSMAGLPPLFGFLGKELFYEAGLHAAFQYLLTAATVLTGVLLFALAGVVGYRPFFGRRRRKQAEVDEAPVSLWLGPAVLAAGGLLLGLVPALMNAPVRAAIVAMAPAGQPHVELALFHGLNPALLLSLVSIAGGAVLYRLHGRIVAAGPRLEPVGGWGPAQAYERLIGALNGVAGAQTRILQNGYLRFYLLAVVATTIALVGFALAWRPRLPAPAAGSGVRFHEAVLGLAIIAGTITATRSRSRLTAVAALGVVGVAVALVFALFGAPDLAMTQLAVDTLTVILLVLVLYHLPDFSTFSGRRHRIRDVGIALAGGAVMAVLVVAAASVSHAPSISPYYLENSYSLAHGRNVVNVILTDFRSLDTLGEITVVGVSAVGVWALLRLRPKEGRKK